MADCVDSARPRRLLRYLPLVLLITASVVVLPVVLVSTAIRGGDIPSIALASLATIAVSIAIAAVESSLWTRLCRSGDLSFAELMLWGWLRRCWAERGLAEQRDLRGCAEKITPAVSIEQLQRLSLMLQARDPYTHGHSRRVARHAELIARRMRLPAQEVAKIRTAATVHDVGKIYTPREILNNPGRLTDAEFEVVKRHAADGAEMLATVGSPDVAGMVRHHHERIDGRGYPDGLAGEDIPIGARIIAVADTFDALTSSRSYRDASTHRLALRILSREAGSQLDRGAVAAFLSIYSSRRSIGGLSVAAILPQRVLAALQAASTGLGVSASGAASLLPALGASGLLALSSAAGHRPRSGSARSHRQDTVAEAGGGAATPSQGASPGTSTAASGSPGHSRARRSTEIPIEAGPQSSATREGQGASGERTTGTSEGATGISAPSSTSNPSSPPATRSEQDAEPGQPAGSGEPEAGEPASGPGQPPAVESPPAGASRIVAGATGIVAGATGALTSTTGAALSGATETVTSTTEALTGSKPLSEAGESLLSGATGTLAETTGSLLSGASKTLSSATGTLLGGGSAPGSASGSAGAPPEESSGVQR